MNVISHGNFQTNPTKYLGNMLWFKIESGKMVPSNIQNHIHILTIPTLENFSRRETGVTFLIFSRKQALTFHSQTMHEMPEPIF